MEIREVRCKTCMTKSKLSDYVINPYTGCQHGCKYCYATFIRRFQNIKEEWGEFCYAKTNCPDLLVKELEKNKSGHIWMSSVTDCYTPLENKCRLTRKILETIASSPHRAKFPIEILTKSALVKRDFDLLKELGAELGMSMNTLDEKVSRAIEPLASSPRERVETLREAKNQGIKVYGFLSPVLPGITNLEGLFRELHFCDYFWVELLNTKPSVLRGLMPVIKEKFPDKVKGFDFAIEHPDEYYKKIKQEVGILKNKYNLKIRDIVVHNAD